MFGQPSVLKVMVVLAKQSGKRPCISCLGNLDFLRVVRAQLS